MRRVDVDDGSAREAGTPVGEHRAGRAGHRPTATVSVPARLRFLEVARSAVRAAWSSGCDAGCLRDLLLAADELASILIVSAEYPSQLGVAVTDDEADANVRMLVPVSPGGFHGDELVGVLQRALVDDARR
jgi:hypothetical protein